MRPAAEIAAELGVDPAVMLPHAHHFRDYFAGFCNF
jgi:hypothetical protein